MKEPRFAASQTGGERVFLGTCARLQRRRTALWRGCSKLLRSTINPQFPPAFVARALRRRWRERLSVSACNHRRDALTNLVK